MSDPTCRIERPVPPLNFSRIPADQIFALNANDPSLTARDACGAIKVTSRDFRMIGPERDLQVPVSAADYVKWVGNTIGPFLLYVRWMGNTTLSSYEVRPFPPLPCQVDGKHRWRTAIRSGPFSRGDGAKSANSTKCTPPTLPNVSVRELFGAPSAPGQVGNPPTMNTDASLG